MGRDGECLFKGAEMTFCKKQSKLHRHLVVNEMSSNTESYEVILKQQIGNTAGKKEFDKYFEDMREKEYGGRPELMAIASIKKVYIEVYEFDSQGILLKEENCFGDIANPRIKLLNHSVHYDRLLSAGEVIQQAALETESRKMTEEEKWARKRLQRDTKLAKSRQVSKIVFCVPAIYGS